MLSTITAKGQSTLPVYLLSTITAKGQSRLPVYLQFSAQSLQPQNTWLFVVVAPPMYKTTPQTHATIFTATLHTFTQKRYQEYETQRKHCTTVIHTTSQTSTVSLKFFPRQTTRLLYTPEVKTQRVRIIICSTAQQLYIQNLTKR